VRFDNLLNSPWLNVKVGKFELDSFISEKRELNLSASGATYQLFHFIPVVTGYLRPARRQPIRCRWMGHSYNDRTRLSITALNSVDGSPDRPYGQNSYSWFLAGSQAFNTGKLGVQRVGGYAMVGQAATTYPPAAERRFQVQE